MQLLSKHSHYGINATWRNDRLWVDTLPTPIPAFSYKEKNATQQALSMILVSNPISLNGCPWALRSLACPFKDYTRRSLRLKQRGLVREGRRERMNAGVTEQFGGSERSPPTFISLYKLSGLPDSCEALTTEALEKIQKFAPSLISVSWNTIQTD